METTLFIILINIVMLVLVIGILVFVFQYRRRKLLYEKEKMRVEETHKLELLNAQLISQEQTMQFIGREIHDSVAQKLTLATIYTQKMEYENQFPAMAVNLRKVSSVLNDSLEELRDLSRSLTDHRMQEASLAELLELECARVNDTGTCRAMTHSDFEGTVSVLAKSFILRIVQEFIQNSLKHSQCDLITFQLHGLSDGIRLSARDNGIGFDSTNVQSRGIGLGNMKRRVHLLGGFFNLQSEPGKGTHLVITIPGKNLVAE